MTIGKPRISYAIGMMVVPFDSLEINLGRLSGEPVRDKRYRSPKAYILGGLGRKVITYKVHAGQCRVKLGIPELPGEIPDILGS